MRAGRLVQLGTPWEVYRTPRSRSVATFLGETNLLEARVSSREGENVRVSAGPLSLLAKASSGFEPGAEVELSIRPECVRLADAPEGPGSFRVVVERCSYLGELSEHELSCGGLALRAYELNPRHAISREAGSEAWASVSPEDVVLLELDKAT
jgi:ABC-type Fe3+/spermidine/putrescine transport system ATPase subunit